MPGILIDVTRLLYLKVTGQILTGIDRVTLEYIRHYAGRARAVLSYRPLSAAVSPEASSRLFRKLLDGDEDLRAVAIEMFARAIGWNWFLPGVRGSILFNTSTLWLNYRTYGLQLRWAGARPVFFVHDLIPITHPEYFPPGEKELHTAIIRNCLTITRGLVVNSRDTQAELESVARELKLACPPVVVAPLAPSVARSRAPGPPPTGRPYFVCVGTIQPRKNHLLLLHVWRRLVETQGDAAPRLFVIGTRGWEYENIVDLLERSEPLKGFVFEENDCGDERLADILRHARALLMPSFAEGYGIPVAEALAAGVPVIASEVAAFREIGGEVPEYADPLDGPGWLRLIEEYARPDSPRRRAQLERMAGFRPSTWAEHFRTVDDFIESLP